MIEFGFTHGDFAVGKNAVRIILVKKSAFLLY